MEHIKENLAAAKSEWEKGNHKAAKHYYDLVLESDPENPEAELYAEYYDLLFGDDETVYAKYMSFSDVIKKITIAAQFYYETEAEQEAILSSLADILNDLRWQIYYRFYNRASKTHSKEDAKMGETANKVSVLNFYYFGDIVEVAYGDNESIVKKIAVKAWKAGIDAQRQWVAVPCDKNDVVEAAEKIRKYEPDYVLPKENILRKYIGLFLKFLAKRQQK